MTYTKAKRPDRGQTDWANEYRIIKLDFKKRKVTKHFLWSTGVPWEDKKKGLGARDEVALGLWPPQGSPPGQVLGERGSPGRSSLHPAWAWLYQTGSGRDVAGQNPKVLVLLIWGRGNKSQNDMNTLGLRSRNSVQTRTRATYMARRARPCSANVILVSVNCFSFQTAS